jgi:threonine/homoserine/homoserine lactone efflux protein
MNSLLTLAAATAVLVLIPGPNVALIVANSLKFGFRAGVYTALGTTAGVGLQLILVVLGLAAAISIAADALAWIRWAGVVYLIYLGLRTWREPADDLGKINAAPAKFWHGLLIAALNPKTLIFNAAFIPQFVGTADASLVRLCLVAAVFLIVLLVGDVLWAAFANSARDVLGRYTNLRNRLTGLFLTAAGIGLALARR